MLLFIQFVNLLYCFILFVGAPSLFLTRNTNKGEGNTNKGEETPLRRGTPRFTLITISLLILPLPSTIVLTVSFTVHYTRSPRGGRLRCEG